MCGRLACAVIVTCMACETIPYSQTFVELNADVEATTRARRLRVEVWHGENRTDQRLSNDGQEVRLGVSPLPVAVPLYPRGNDSSRLFDFEAVLLDDLGTPFAVQRLRSTFAQNRITTQRLFFSDECNDVLDCPVDTTCELGMCVPSYRAPDCSHAARGWAEMGDEGNPAFAYYPGGCGPAASSSSGVGRQGFPSSWGVATTRSRPGGAP
jgi:hypothetical protein